MDIGEKKSVYSIRFAIIGCIGFTVYFIFAINFVNYLFSPEYISKLFENPESSIEILLTTFAIMIVAMAFGLSSLVFMILGGVFGLYSIKRVDREGKYYRFALAGTIIGVAGFVLAIIIMTFYSITFAIRTIFEIQSIINNMH